MTLRLRSHGWLIGVLAVATFAMLFRLGDRPIENWDEGIHGAVSLEMVEDGDWLTPHYMGGSYFRKPPLKIWMSTALFEAFGANAWTLRIPSALAGIATSLLVAWWMWQWRRNRLDAFLAGAIVATMRPIFFHGFRTGEMDGMLTFFVIVALYSWWRAVTCVLRTTHECPMSNVQCPNKSQLPKSQTTKWFALCGVAIGLAVITKSAAGLLPVPIILTHAVITGAWRHITLRDIGLTLLTFTFVAAPWHIIMTVLHGAAFWQDYLGWHVVKRATEALHNEGAGIWWYVPTLLRRFSPYSFMFVPALFYAVWILWTRARGMTRMEAPLTHASIEHAAGPQRQNPERDGILMLLCVWFLLGFVLFTLMKTKLDWYLLPLYPAAAMLIVWFLAEIRAAIHSRMIRITYVITLVIFLGAGGTITAHHLWRIDPSNPFTDIAATIRGSEGVLVSHALDYKQYPAGYLILRNALQNDVRILDGQSDVRRTLGMLATPNHPGFLLTRNEMELPKELRAAVANPQMFGGFTLWQRL